MNKKLFIIGLGGLTGHKLAKLAKKYFEVMGSYNLRNPKLDDVKHFKIDLENFQELIDSITKINPDYIVNTAGINNVDYCEENQKLAFKINFEVVKELTEFCNSKKIKLIQLSTDSVFDGKKNEPYLENDSPNPINVYGKTKYEAEKVVLKNPENIVIRTSVLYGQLPKELSKMNSSSMKPLNFSQWLIGKLENNENVKIVVDEYSSPILVDDFAKSILHLIKNNHSGLFHSAPNLKINRFDFCKKIATEFNYDLKLILPTTIKELGRDVSTGENKVLNSEKLANTNFRFLTLAQSLELLKKQFSK